MIFFFSDRRLAKSMSCWNNYWRSGGGLALGRMRARALGASCLGGRASIHNNSLAPPRPASLRLRPSEFVSLQSHTAHRSAFATSTLEAQRFGSLPSITIDIANPFHGNSLQEKMTAGTITSERELLPANVRPMHYDLCVEPDLEAKVFSGTVNVTVKVRAAAGPLVL